MEQAALRQEVTQAQLDALRMELNPHFLFNTLNAISALAQRGERAGVVCMIARLGELLRRTLDRHGETEITLAEEIELLELYLDLERTRFGERLTIELAVDPLARDALVPSFVLQPLAENAMRHGAAAVRGRVLVEVRARVDGARLSIAVRDTGPGPGAGKESDSGIGLRNTRARLATLYGEEASLEVRRAEGGGTESRLLLPLRRERVAGGG